MKFGVNTWVWVSPLTTDEVIRLAPHVKSLGFDWFEVPLEGLSDLDYKRAGSVIKDNGLGVSVCAAMGLCRSPSPCRENQDHTTTRFRFGCSAQQLGSGICICCRK